MSQRAQVDTGSIVRNTVWWSTNGSGVIETAILISPLRNTCCSESNARPASSLWGRSQAQTHAAKTHYGFLLWIPIMDSHYGFLLWIPIMDSHHGFPSWIPIMDSHHGFPLCFARLPLYQVGPILHHNSQLAMPATRQSQTRRARVSRKRDACRQAHRSALCHCGTRCSRCTHSWPLPSAMHASHASSMQRV